tara:strand:- start:865 stop:1770 length:906 start_codon:yes stop_codon:yes gene_type:complete
MKTAIIDLGTNTFNLLIVEGNIKLFKTKIAVKLGEGGITKGYIAEAPFQRGFDALKKHLQTIEAYQVDRTLAFATSAIRSTSNGVDFVAKVKTELGLHIEVIDGEKEAELIYLGVQQALDLGDDNKLIMDIGGGSTEFIICNKKEIFWKQSFQLGAARLLEHFQPQDPITSTEVKTIEVYLEDTLTPLWAALQKFPCDTLVGSSGSFDTLADVIAHHFYDIAILKGKTTYNFKLSDYYWLHDYFLKSNLEERLNTPGMIPMRAYMIVISSIFINYLLKSQKMLSMKLSTYALKEGVLKTLS